MLFFCRLTVLVALMGLVMPFTISTAQAVGVGSVTDVSGVVKVVRNNHASLAIKGMPVMQGDRIETGAKSTAKITMKAGDVITIGYKSQFEITEYKVSQENKLLASFRALAGKFMFQLNKLTVNRYTVKTKTVVLGVRGTSWLMSVAAQLTETAGLSGTVAATSSGQTVSLTAGNFVSATLTGLSPVIATPAAFIAGFAVQGIVVGTSVGIVGGTTGSSVAATSGGAAGAGSVGATAAAAGISTTALVGGAAVAAVAGGVALNNGGDATTVTPPSAVSSCANGYAGNWVGTSTFTNCPADGPSPNPFGILDLVVANDCTIVDQSPNVQPGDTLSVSVDPNTGAVSGTSTTVGSNCNPTTISGTLNGTAPGSTGSGNSNDVGGGTGTWQVTKQGAPNPVNNPPVAVNDTATTLKNTPVTTGNVVTNDTDIDGDILTVSLVDAASANAGSIVNNNNNTFTYTPALGFVGTDTFTYTVSDGKGGTAVGTVTVTVTAPVNNPPVAVNDTATTPKNTPVTINVLANDTDPDGDVLIVTQTGGGAVINVNNTITYTPLLNFTGTDTFVYNISDGNGGVASASITVTVVAPAVLNDFTPNVSPPSYTCSGSCQITGTGVITPTNLSVNGSTVTLDFFSTPTNGPVDFTNVSGSGNANSVSQNIFILGQSGHNCSLTRVSNIQMIVQCQDNFGGFCSDSCSR